MKKIITVIVIVAIVVAASTSALAAESCCCAPMGVGYTDITELPGLNLTTQQKSRIISLKESYINPLQQKMFNKRNELRIILRSRPPDQSRVMAAEKELIAIREQLYEKHESYRQGVLNILTAKQKTKLRGYGFNL